MPAAIEFIGLPRRHGMPSLSRYFPPHPG